MNKSHLPSGETHILEEFIEVMFRLPEAPTATPAVAGTRPTGKDTVGNSVTLARAVHDLGWNGPATEN